MALNGSMQTQGNASSIGKQRQEKLEYAEGSSIIILAKGTFLSSPSQKFLVYNVHILLAVLVTP